MCLWLHDVDKEVRARTSALEQFRLAMAADWSGHDGVGDEKLQDFEAIVELKRVRDLLPSAPFPAVVFQRSSS